MTHEELVQLIQAAVGSQPAGAVWADFGAGTGHFTRALRELVGPEAVIFAVDRDGRALATNTAATQHILADFTQPLPLPPLHGLLMANALHFVRDQVAMLKRCASCLYPDGRLVLVEYDVTRSPGYVPFPVPYARFADMAREAGFGRVARTADRRSPSSGIVMYTACATPMDPPGDLSRNMQQV